MTADLLIENNKFMKEKVKFVVVLMQESGHILRPRLGKKKCIFPAKKFYVRVGTMENGMLFILEAIACLA